MCVTGTGRSPISANLSGLRLKWRAIRFVCRLCFPCRRPSEAYRWRVQSASGIAIVQRAVLTLVQILGRNILETTARGEDKMADDWQEQQRQERERQEQQHYQEQQRQERERQERERQEQQRYQEQQRLRTPDDVKNQAKSDHAQSPTGWADQSGWSTESKNAYDAQRSFEQREQQRKLLEEQRYQEEQRQLKKPFWKFW